MNFRKIPGNEAVKDRLRTMFRSGRIGHALTLAGPEGTASLALAIAFVTYINCKNRKEEDSCGICPSCQKMEGLVHPDVHFYFPTAISSSVPKKATSAKYLVQWRSFLSGNIFVSLPSWLRAMDAESKEAFISADESLQIIRDLTLKAFESENRFAIIWLPEKLNITSSNKLLKIIEEPPPGVYFILVTENHQLLLQTIMSRTQLMMVGQLSDEALTEWLREKFPQKDREEINKAVASAGGSPVVALSAMNEGDNQNDFAEVFINWARLCYRAYDRMPELIKSSENIAEMNRSDQKEILEYGLNFLRGSLLHNYGSADLIHGSRANEDTMKNFASLLSPETFQLMVSSFEEALGDIEKHANAKILFMNLSLNFARGINAKNVTL